MRTGMEITRKDVVTMVEKIRADKVVSTDFTDTKLGEALVSTVVILDAFGANDEKVVTTCEDILSSYIQQVGADFGRIFEPVEVLDEIEKNYLGTLVKPYTRKYNVKVVKRSLSNAYYLVIKLYNKNGTVADNIVLPDFSPASKMYEGMELCKEYSLKELGLV